MKEEEINEEVKEQEETATERATERKKVIRKGIQWKKKYIALEERYNQLQGKLDEEVADIEIEDDEEENEDFKCPECRVKIEKYNSFCSACGAKLNWSDE